MDRRTFLKIILGIPVLGTLALYASPVLRYLRPSTGPITDTKINLSGKSWQDWQGEGGLFAKPDLPQSESPVEFSLSQFPGPWSSQTFTFRMRSKEYTFQHFQTTKIPGFVVRLPQNKPDGQPDFIIVSRICPHMGCVYNFLEDPAEAALYNYPQAKTPLFACPCHLSVFDPLQKQDVGLGNMLRGKVVSGPAPRPPRQFTYEVVGDTLRIIKAETGGIS
jgi:Rieske Fe-S protein